MPMKLLVLLAAGVLAIVPAGCRSDPPLTVGGPSASAPAKPDITQLTDAMVLKESGFPTVAGGKYKLTSVKTIDKEHPGAEDCDINKWFRAGDQQAGARVSADSGRYTVALIRTQTKADIQGWSKRCLPHTKEKETISAADLPDLSADAIGMQRAVDSKLRSYGALGYARGILVFVSVDHGKQDLPANAQADAAKIFNNQVAQLNSI